MLSYTRKGSSQENAGSVKLNSVPKFVVAEMSPPVVDGFPSRAANLPPNALMPAPHQDAMPHGRFSSSPDETASNRKLLPTTPEECGCDEEPTTLQRMWPSAANPSTRNSTLSMLGSRVVSFSTINCYHMKKKKGGACGLARKMTKTRGARHKYCIALFLNATSIFTLLDDVKARSCFY